MGRNRSLSGEEVTRFLLLLWIQVIKDIHDLINVIIGLGEHQLPSTESLKDTFHRLLPLWNESIKPSIKSGKKVLIVAHGNSLRALVKHLNGISDDEIKDLNIPTGVPYVFELDGQLKSQKYYFLK